MFKTGSGPDSGRLLNLPQSGVSLIEVLVSLVVVSVGVLSAVSLQLVSKRNNHDASQRLEATHLAYGLIERMRANSSGDALRAYVASASPYVGRARVGTMPSPNCSASSVACTPRQLAAFELWLWEQLMDGATERINTGAGMYYTGGLLLPTACVDPPDAGAGQPGVYTVTIAFRGAVALGTDPAVACGQAAKQDGFRIYGERDEFRRSVTLTAYIAPTAAK